MFNLLETASWSLDSERRVEPWETLQDLRADLTLNSSTRENSEPPKATQIDGKIKQLKFGGG